MASLGKKSANKMSLLSRLLNFPFIYNCTQFILGMDSFSKFRKIIGKYPHVSVVEIGCGPGGILHFMKVKKYLGIDINQSYIDHAKKIYKDKVGIKSVCGDAKNISHQKGKFDLVVLINFAHHLSDHEMTILLKKIKINMNFSRLILIDGKPDFKISNRLLEIADQGNYFRDLGELKNILNKSLNIESAFTLKKKYWLYKYSVIIAQKTPIN